ncbi:hypothetical protein BGZ73_005311 [Actinomortierella ambigua]|nr:hypothetical protein BGZ73_005311 [Actinomortierella ambigua]
MAAESKLSLQNALLTLEQLQHTPSMQDGFTEQQEDDMRQMGCHLIQSAGILLKLPQVAMATAQILFQRFFYQASLRKFAIRDISMGSIFLAAKVEECPCRMRDLVNVIDHLCKTFKGLPTTEPLALYGQEFYEMKNAAVIAEMQILKKLGFNVHVQLPYAIMVNYLKVLNLTDHPTIPQRAWGYLNDGTEQYSSDEEQERKLAESMAAGIEPPKALLRHSVKAKKVTKHDVFSTLPDSVLRMILSLLQPHQMLVLSELSRKFYEFIVLGQEMNEVWFRLVQQEQIEARKREEWFLTKLREQEHRAVHMARTFSGSSAFSSSGYSSLADDDGLPVSNQQKRLAKKKDSSVDKVKAMRRSDRKKNWCKVYVDTILRGIEEERPINRRQRDSAMGNIPLAKPVAKFQTITLNASLPEPVELQGREAITQNKIEKRAYYKSIRAKPKGKKASQDSHSNHERIERAHSQWEEDGSEY